MPKLEIPAPPEVKFGVWDRNGNPTTKNSKLSSRIGFRIWPSYYGFSDIMRTREQVTSYWVEAEQQFYENNLRSLMVKALDLGTFLVGKRITSVRFSPARGYICLEIQIEGITTPIRFKSSRYNYSDTQVILPETEGPWEVARWLKTGKAIRLTDKQSIYLDFFGRLRIDSVPDQLLEELFGPLPSL